MADVTIFDRFSYGYLIEPDDSLTLRYTNVTYSSADDPFKIYPGHELDAGNGLGRLLLVGTTYFGSDIKWVAEAADGQRYAFSYVAGPGGSGSEVNNNRLVVEQQPIAFPPQPGTWSATLSADLAKLLPDGLLGVSAQVLNGTLNEQTSREIHVDLTTPPPPPPDEIGLTFDAVTGDNHVTSQEKVDGVTLTGTAHGLDGAPLNLHIIGSGFLADYQLHAGTNGTWSFELPDPHTRLRSGSYTATVEGSDETVPAARQHFTVDPQSNITIDTVAGDDVINAAEAQHDIIISGHTIGEDGKPIKVSILYTTQIAKLEQISTVFSADTVAKDGAWSITIPSASAQLLPNSAPLSNPDPADLRSSVVAKVEGLRAERGFVVDFGSITPPPPPPPPPEDDVGINTYDDTKQELHDRLIDQGVPSAVRDYIIDHVSFHNYADDGKGSVVPVEVVSLPFSKVDIDYVQDVHGKNPQVLFVEPSGKTVNTDLDPSLKFVVEASDTDATLNIVGSKAGVGIGSTDPGSDTIVSSTTGAHETILAGDAGETFLQGGNGSHDLVQTGNGNADTLIAGSGAWDTVIAGDGDGDLLVAGTGAHQSLQAGDGQGDHLQGGSGAWQTVTAGNGDNDLLLGGSGSHQLLQAGDGANDTLTAGIGGDTLSGSGDFTTFNLGAAGDNTIIAGGVNDTISFAHDSTHLSITEDDATDTVTIKFSDTGQTVKLIGDDQGIDLHFSDNATQHLT